ncbi:protein D3-like [Panonychus citri]|uniref:protein D3-like n=1 Tax=Panonychus citri TaxID=50023 RepID=UPI0023072413|nr:protein D3-like [Panonychus citri]
MFSPFFKLFIFFTVNIINVQSQHNYYRCPYRYESVEESFRENKIIRDLDLDETQIYDNIQFIPLKYPNSDKVTCGAYLTKKATMKEPQVTFDPVGKKKGADKKLFTFMMVDPDAPTPRNATSRSILHWLVVNIKGNNMKTGTTLAKYLPPAPTPNKGAHRYVFLIYRQPKEVASRKTYVTLQERSNFQVTSFAIQNRLSGPIAGNFFNEAVQN